MKALLWEYLETLNWDLLPVWVTLSFFSGWLSLLTIFYFSEQGLSPAEVEPLLTIFEWMPLLLVVIPFARPALQMAVDRAIEVDVA